MRVILQTSRIDGHMSQAPGDVIEVDGVVGQRLIDSGQARAVDGGRPVQTASKRQNNRGQRMGRESREVRQ